MNGSSLPATNLLGVQFAEQQAAAQTVADCFPRGRDLAVTYAPAFERPVRLQIYWRAAEAVDCLAAIDVQVSVQTSLPAAWPAVIINSNWPGTTALQLSPDGQVQELRPAQRTIVAAIGGCWMWRLPGLGVTYCQMVHPHDEEHTELLVSANRVRVGHYLFADSLEKGVIRLRRARGAFVPIENDARRAAKLYRSFLDALLPLTT